MTLVFGWLVNSLMSKVMRAFLAGGGCLEPARVVAGCICLGIGSGPDCSVDDGCLLVLELLLFAEMGVWGGEGALFTFPPLVENPEWLVCLL